MYKNVSLIIVFSLVLIFITCRKKDVLDVPSSITARGVPSVTTDIVQKLEKYQNYKTTVNLDWLADGSGIVVRRRVKDTEQLHILRGPGDTLQQITSFDEAVLFAYVCPDSNDPSLLFVKDHKGNERFQLYRMDLSSFAVSPVTDDSAQNSSVVWSESGTRFVYSSNRRNGKDFDITLAYPDESQSERLLVTEGGAWGAMDWSPNEDKILVGKYRSRTSSMLYEYIIATGELKSLSDTADEVSMEEGLYGPDGNGAFYTSDQKTDFRCLHHRNLVTGADTLLTADLKWDVRGIHLSHDRSLLVFTTDEDGFSELYLVNTRTFIRSRIAGLPKAIIGSFRFHPDGTKLAVTINAPDYPENVYVYDLDDSTLHRWTTSEMADLDTTKLVKPLVISYPTFDSADGVIRKIPCFIYTPVTAGKPYPVLISIHGGPESQYWPSYRPTVQYYCGELGVAVFAPNVRGSAGYGKTFLKLDNGKKRQDAVKDIGALLHWIRLHPEFDSTRIVVSGGSYGGYMVLASLVSYSSIRGGIDYYGISNFVTFLHNTSSYRRDLRRVEYGDERDSSMRTFLERISPLNNARRIRSPLLIVQGAQDARVPLSESEQMERLLRQKGLPVWMVIAENEGHGFRRKSNRDYAAWVEAMFLERIFFIE